MISFGCICVLSLLLSCALSQVNVYRHTLTGTGVSPTLFSFDSSSKNLYFANSGILGSVNTETMTLRKTAGFFTYTSNPPSSTLVKTASSSRLWVFYNSNLTFFDADLNVSGSTTKSLNFLTLANGKENLVYGCSVRALDQSSAEVALQIFNLNNEGEITSNTEHNPFSEFTTLRSCISLDYDSVQQEAYFLGQSFETSKSRETINKVSGDIDIVKTAGSRPVDLVIHNGTLIGAFTNSLNPSNVTISSYNLVLDPAPVVTTITRFSSDGRAHLAFEVSSRRLYVGFTGANIAVFDVLTNFSIVFREEFSIDNPITGKPLFVESIEFDANDGVGYAVASQATSNVNSQITNINLYKFSLGNCQQYSSCGQCKSQRFCGWCFLEGKCTARGLCNDNSTFITGESLCPVITSGSISPQVIYQGKTETVLVTSSNAFINPATAKASLSYTCNFSSGAFITQGTYVSPSSVSCSSPFSAGFSSTQLRNNLSFRVELNGINYAGPFSLNVTNCQVNNLCRDCVQFSNECYWCESTGKCSANGVACASSLLSSCPPPSITSVSASKGPISGGVIVEIEGKYYTTDLEEIQIAGVICNKSITVISDDFISCVTSETSSPVVGPVSLSFSGSGWTNSSQQFEYVADPSIESFFPSVSVKGFSFHLILNGKNLDTLTPTIEVGSNCQINEINSTYINCTFNSPSAYNGKVSLTMADAKAESSQNLLIADPPTLESVSTPRSPAAGGITLQFQGANLDTSDIELFLGISACLLIDVNSTSLTCETQSGSGQNQPISVKMLGISFQSTLSFNFVPNPIITDFVPKSSDLLNSDRSLAVYGQNFLSGPILIDAANCSCKITTLTDNTIICQLQSNCTNTGPITIQIGNSLVATTAQFQYIEPTLAPPTQPPTQSPTPTQDAGNLGEGSSKVVGAVVGSLFALLFVALIIFGFLFYRHRRNSLNVKHRKKVVDASVIVFKDYKDSGVDLNEKALKDLEAELEAIFITDNFEVFKFMNEGSDGENVMKAVGLFIFDKNYVLPVFEYFCQKELETAENEKRLFRGPDVCSRLFRAVLKPICFNMYWDVLGPIFDLLMESNVVVTGEKLTKATSQVEMMNEKEMENFELNIYKLQLVSHQLVAEIMRSRGKMPITFRQILFAVGKNAEQKYGLAARNTTLTTFLVLRYLSAILINPRNYGILKENQKQVPETISNTLSNLSSIIVKLSAGKEFVEQDGKLAELNPFIRSHVQKFEKFFDEIMDESKVSNEPNACQGIPKYAKSVVLAEITNTILKNKEKIAQLSDEETKKKLESFVESHPKPISYSNKNFSFSQL